MNIHVHLSQNSSANNPNDINCLPGFGQLISGLGHLFFFPRTALWPDREGWEDAHPNRAGVFEVPGLWLPHIQLDWMHSKHLGVDQNLLGSTLAFLTTYKMRELGSEADNMHVVWNQIKETYEEALTPSRFSIIVPNMYKHDPFPLLRGKAAEIKDLVPIMAVVARAFLDPTVEYDALVLKALETSAYADQILYENKDHFFLEGRVLERFQASIHQYNTILVELGLRSHPQGIRLWNFTPKNHMLIHIGEQAEHLNPVLSWNYGAESFLSQVRQLIAACKSRLNMMQCQRAVMSKWLRSLEMALGAKLDELVWVLWGRKLWPRVSETAAWRSSPQWSGCSWS